MKTRDSNYKWNQEIPNKISDTEVLEYIQTKKISSEDLNDFKKLTGFTDEIIADWFDISVKTFRTYQKSNSNFSIQFEEKFLILSSLFKQGWEIFGSSQEFKNWLRKENFFFDEKAPLSFLNTISGIRYIENRLTAMEFGDNI